MHDYTIQYWLVLHTIIKYCLLCLVLYNIVLYSVQYSKGLNCSCTHTHTLWHTTSTVLGLRLTVRLDPGSESCQGRLPWSLIKLRQRLRVCQGCQWPNLAVAPQCSLIGQLLFAGDSESLALERRGPGPGPHRCRAPTCAASERPGLAN